MRAEKEAGAENPPPKASADDSGKKPKLYRVRLCSGNFYLSPGVVVFLKKT
jgi:hypothetical protein